MSKVKREKKSATQQQGAEAILKNRDLDKNPLTAASFFDIVGFLMLWSACFFVLYGTYTCLGMAFPYSIIAAIFSGLLSATIVLGIFKGVGSRGYLTHWCSQEKTDPRNPLER